jgi:glucan phosphoethanolaminetransferase (alkaline phosphatase superfamily)
VEEQIFLDENQILVTNTRLVLENEIYALSKLQSVKMLEGEKSNLIGWIITGGFLAVVGFLFTDRVQDAALKIVLGIATLICLVIVTAAIVHMMFYKPEHKVTATFSSGEMVMIENTDLDFIRQVVKALNDVIVLRA